MIEALLYLALVWVGVSTVLAISVYVEVFTSRDHGRFARTSAWLWQNLAVALFWPVVLVIIGATLAIGKLTALFADMFAPIEPVSYSKIADVQLAE